MTSQKRLERIGIEPGGAVVVSHDVIERAGIAKGLVKLVGELGIDGFALEGRAYLRDTVSF